ncbi:MAG: AGE family epimerase/isomerase [Treponema sp.]|jgi:N-acylglucosamine 2-epimerase|nr:AGE family epimerase/isomerase [Treponema sp.]
MNKEVIKNLRYKYEESLFKQVIPFWERYSPDKEYGGYFSCLDRDGTVFDTDKFAWMQGREVWTFARLHNRAGDAEKEKRDAWLTLARLGAEFLRNHGRSPEGDLYFALDRKGRPLVEPYNIFSEYFAAAGFAEYYRASGEPWALEEARKSYTRITARKSNPKGRWTKQIGINRPVKAMGMCMMDTWLTGELAGIVPAGELDALAAAAEKQIFDIHIDRENQTVFERVLPDGGHPDCMEGRLINPGHALETLWLVLQNVSRRGDAQRTADIADIMLWCIRRGWDEKYGGLFYYQDYRGFPPEKLESDMKLWWVHAEALCAFLLAYKLTGRSEHEEWFHKIDEYTFGHFPDLQYGEWYGYLDRRGDPALTQKGGKWKGFFHLPRTLMTCIDWFKDMETHGAE